MINKVGLSYNIKFQNNFHDKSNKALSTNTPPQVKPACDNGFSPFYYPINFTGKKTSKAQQMTPQEVLEYHYTNSATKLVNESTAIAQKYQNPEVNHFHVWKAELNYLDKYIAELNNGTKYYNSLSGDSIQSFLEAVSADGIFNDEKKRAKLQTIIKEENSNLDKILEQLPKDTNIKEPQLSEELVLDIWAQRDNDNDKVYDFHIFGSNLYSENEDVKKFTENFLQRVCDMAMVEHLALEERSHIKDYDDKASNVWKNLALGTNMFITFDQKKVNANMFITSLYHTKPDDTELLEFNGKINERFLFDKIKELTKNKDKNYALILRPSNLVVNSASPEDREKGRYAYSSELQEAIKKPPTNIKYIMIDLKDNYFSGLQTPRIQAMYENYGEISIPVLSTQQFVKAFKEVPQLTNEIKKPFSKKALEKTVENAAQLDGIFPDKACNLMKKMASYYIDKKEISEKDVINYIKEAKELFRKNEDDSSISVVFDTGKRLKDIVGKDATKKEATAIVKQIKSNRMGTKGMIIYSQDSIAGAGRRFIAKTIAGEAKVPYMEINAMDFGTKEVDIFDDHLLTPEASIKKMFSLVNSQAENNPNSAAVLFIENFEYFSIGELISEYQQKAMAQLLREMDNAERKGLNILVIGSVSDPQLMGEATMKSFKFVDSIEVSSPANNTKERADIIKETIKENRLKIAGKTPEEKEEIINSIAKTTKGFPFIYMKNIVKKAQSVALERGHKEIQKGDFTEAFLQVTTGRPSTNVIQPHEKVLTTSHECGHALNGEIMNNIAKDYGKLWHKPYNVDFITLDPRGFYGGAVYRKNDMNNEVSFERMFSDIVCSYGGHSAEKYFFDMDGSMGISYDLEAATDDANAMIKIMGQGKRVGKQSFWNNSTMSDNMRNLIEQDRKVILDNALFVSDLITEVYEDFNKEFTEKYAHLVGTGDCLIDGDVFRQELADWKARQPEEKQTEIKVMEGIILDVMAKTKKGQKY